MIGNVIQIDEVRFSLAVESLAIAYRHGKDTAGLRCFARANLIDLCRACRRALVKQGARDGFVVVIESWDKMTESLVSVAANHPSAVRAVDQPIVVEPEEEA